MRVTLVLTLVLATLAASWAAAQRDHSATDRAGNSSVARLIVTVSGDPSDWGNWGFLWDNGRRLDSRPFTPVTGLLDLEASRRSAENSNKKIYLAITDKAWGAGIGPTETEILQCISNMGWELFQMQDGGVHPLLPADFDADRITTYWFR